MKQIGYPISTQHFEGRMEKAFCIKQYISFEGIKINKQRFGSKQGVQLLTATILI